MSNRKSFTALAILAVSFFSCKQRAVPRPDHVIIVMEENHSYDQLIGSANAPFINQLAKEGALFTNSHGITHPSQPNYLAIFSGSIQGVLDDKCLEKETPYTTPNLGSALLSKGFTFKGFAETMPSAGYTGCNYLQSDLTHGGLYARKHAPWVDWQGPNPGNIPASLSLPMTQFPRNFNDLPDLAFVIPNQDYDMHNIGDPGDSAAIHRGDQWLQENLGPYVEWAKTHNSLLILTFDEDDFTPANRIPTLFAGEMVMAGQYPNKINHYDVLHTIEAMYDLPVTDTTHAGTITYAWKK